MPSKDPAKRRAYQRKYYQENAEAIYKRKRDWYYANHAQARVQNNRQALKSKYGFEGEVPSTCQVCGLGGKICVDHDHATGVVRGFLCNSCNLALGLLKDSPEILQAMMQYLKGEQHDRSESAEGTSA